MNLGIYSQDIWAKIINLRFFYLMIFLPHLCFTNTELYIMENNPNGNKYV